MESGGTDLLGRINAEFAEAKHKLNVLRQKGVEEHRGRLARLEVFEQSCERLKDVWGPRLETLKEAFGERVKVAPYATIGRRQATFSFMSDIARITVTFSASTDFDVRKLVLEYSLEILPILMSFPDHTRYEQPLEQVDPQSIGKWMDDQIVDFVKTYLSLHENEYYLKSHMAVDPVAKVRFPKFAAAATLERNGATLYFMANETRDEFLEKEEKQRNAG